MEFQLAGEALSIYFKYYKYIFQNVAVSLTNSQIIGIIGPNGSGKTTLLKILCALIRPIKGNVTLRINNSIISKDKYIDYVSLVAPYLNLYEEFTAYETIRLIAQFHQKLFNFQFANDLLKKFDLYKKRDDYIKTYSSGMKQRLRFVINFYQEPIIMLFDEPFTNLDDSGIKTLEELISERISNGCGIIIASNNLEEVKFCNSIVNLENQ